MPDFSGLGATFYEAAGAVTASSTGTTISDAGTNTKGSYTELIASTSYPASWIYVSINQNSASDRYLVDIAVGAASSEQVILSNLWHSSHSSGRYNGYCYLLPVTVPAGSRISARCQSSSSAADSVQVVAHVISGAMVSPSGMGVVSTYGADTATSAGTSVDAGGTANTKGAYVEFAASTAYPIKWIVIAIGAIASSISAATSYLVDIAVGASSSEQVIISNIYLAAGTATDVPTPTTIALPVSIPAGSRISARSQCSVNTATERELGIVMYGVS